MRLVPDSYFRTLIMWYIGSFCHPLKRILLCNLQNLSLLIVFVSCCLLPSIHVFVLYFTYVNELEWILNLK